MSQQASYLDTLIRKNIPIELCKKVTIFSDRMEEPYNELQIAWLGYDKNKSLIIVTPDEASILFKNGLLKGAKKNKF